VLFFKNIAPDNFAQKYEFSGAVRKKYGTAAILMKDFSTDGHLSRQSAVGSQQSADTNVY
jgi:hypothetical protein